METRAAEMHLLRFLSQFCVDLRIYPARKIERTSDSRRIRNHHEANVFKYLLEGIKCWSAHSNGWIVRNLKTGNGTSVVARRVLSA